MLGTIEPERYRDLQYFSGSYAVSHAVFRRVWIRGMDLFWRRFWSWCERDIPNSRLR